MIDTPKLTSNALLLLGVIAGSVPKSIATDYRVVDTNIEEGKIIIESHTGNRYSVIVRQIEGVE